MDSSLLPEEVLIGVFAVGAIKNFTANSPVLHRKFYFLSKNPRYKTILKSFKFAGSPAAPFSRVLDTALFNLQYANKLKRLNPDLTAYEFSDEAKKYYEETVNPKIDGSNGDELKVVLREIAIEINGLSVNGQ